MKFFSLTRIYLQNRKIYHYLNLLFGAKVKLMLNALGDVLKEVTTVQPLLPQHKQEYQLREGNETGHSTSTNVKLIIAAALL